MRRASSVRDCQGVSTSFANSIRYRPKLFLKSSELTSPFKVRRRLALNVDGVEFLAILIRWLTKWCLLSSRCIDVRDEPYASNSHRSSEFISISSLIAQYLMDIPNGSLVSRNLANSAAPRSKPVSYSSTSFFAHNLLFTNRWSSTGCEIGLQKYESILQRFHGKSRR